MQQVGQGDWKVLSISAEQPQVETPLKEQETEEWHWVKQECSILSCNGRFLAIFF